MRRKQIRDGRSTDLTFSWITANDKEWVQWAQYAAEWMAEQNTSTGIKQKALTHFIGNYLPKYAPYAKEVKSFFTGHNGHLSSTDEYVEMLSETLKHPDSLSRYCHRTVDFIDWIIERYFTEPDDNCINQPLVSNPISKYKKKWIPSLETVRQPLPYRYIEHLRQILCPTHEQSKGNDDKMQPPYACCHFSHWHWAQQQNGQKYQGGDWFDVEPDLIDKNDPDCVWRTRNCQRKTYYEMWSPVRAMVIFVKLNLPLRTYQVRMLDSGEADTWRYENGLWSPNHKYSFVLGGEKRPFAKGIFKRIYDSMTGMFSTGLYINTNKTADQNKDDIDRGYTIPWQHEELLYWFEKLRNWQEKYNPIEKPTGCNSLKKKHIGFLKSKKQLREMGEICFLFRNAAAKSSEDKHKPIPSQKLDNYWYMLLSELEDQLYLKGKTLENGQRLKFVTDYSNGTPSGVRSATLFPLHALRVSLITAYTMDTELPLPVISKLLAGHSRILMTIFYNKITPSVMAAKMEEAHGQLKQKEQQSIKTFLKEASLNQIHCKTVYHREDSINAALANRNPVGWEKRAYGLCLVGGNTVKSDEISTLGGCWNGGELLQDSNVSYKRIYGPVPHGPENCIRCRWFITDANYLPALNAHFNQLSYKAHQAANIAVELESEIDALKDEEYFSEEQQVPFMRQAEMQSLQRRLERQLVEADEYVKDWVATFKLIGRIVHIEEDRGIEDSNKLIAVGHVSDISYSLKFIETDSELLHLSLLCEDAEFYPDLHDELRKTPAIEKRSRKLCEALMRKGFAPLFMSMDDKQQLIAGNAMLRQMAQIAAPNDKMEGYRKVASYFEAGEYLQNHALLEKGFAELTEHPICLKPLMGSLLLEAE